MSLIPKPAIFNFLSSENKFSTENLCGIKNYEYGTSGVGWGTEA